MWSIDNFGDKAICLIHDAQVFEWDSDLSNATETEQQLYLVHQLHQDIC